MGIEPLENVDPKQLYQLSGELRQLADKLQATPPKLRSPPQMSAEWVRCLIRTRRLREAQFGHGIFADPAWDMLLDLYAARLEGKPVSVSSLCHASAVPATTALRWIRVLEEQGLILRHADPRDGRRIFLEISDDAAEKVEKVLRTALRVAGPIL